MNSLQVLEEQVDLIRYWMSPRGVSYANGYLRSLDKTGDTSFGPEWDAQFLAQNEALRIDRAETYWVHADMVDLMVHAAESFPTSALQEIDLPTPSGFVWLDKSFFTTDLREEQIGTRAFAWSHARMMAGLKEVPGVQITFYSWRDDQDDEGLRNISEDNRRHLPKLLLWHHVHVPFGVEPPAVENVGGMTKTVRAFWRFVQQKLPNNEPRRLDRPTRKRLDRTGYLYRQQEVRVISLRAREYAPRNDEGVSEGREVAWSHRWIQRGHWGKRHCKCHPEGFHVTWVKPGVKGPADRPLIVKDRVFRWNR